MTERPSWSSDSAAAHGRKLAALMTRFDWQRRSLDAQLPLGTADLRILWLFTDRRPRTLREIAGSLRLEQSTVNRQVNAATENGLLERSRPEGSTAYVFSPTDEGLASFERDLASTLGTYDSALARLGDDDTEVLLDLMSRFLDAYRDVLAEMDEGEVLRET